MAQDSAVQSRLILGSNTILLLTTGTCAWRAYSTSGTAMAVASSATIHSHHTSHRHRTLCNGVDHVKNILKYLLLASRDATLKVYVQITSSTTHCVLYCTVQYYTVPYHTTHYDRLPENCIHSNHRAVLLVCWLLPNAGYFNKITGTVWNITCNDDISPG